MIKIRPMVEGWTDICIYCGKRFDNLEVAYECPNDDYYNLCCDNCQKESCVKNECADFDVCDGGTKFLMLNKELWKKIPVVVVDEVKEVSDEQLKELKELKEVIK